VVSICTTCGSIKIFCILPTECIHVFYKTHSTNTSFFPTQNYQNAPYSIMDTGCLPCEVRTESLYVIKRTPVSVRSPRRPGFDPGKILMRCTPVVYKVALGWIFPRLIRFSLAVTIPSMLRAHLYAVLTRRTRGQITETLK
jgi:hypothetical protein